MYGLPNQTVSDVRQSAMLVHKLAPRRLAVFGYAHVPWFKSHQRMFEEASLPPPAERVAQAAAVHETLTGLGYQPVGLDHYAVADDSLVVAARAGRLRRNFQGYTTDEAESLIGLGTSAIGRLPQGFIQNAPDTGGYSRSVMAGRLATVRGLALSDDDRRRGRIIEQLMCNLACDLDQAAVLLDEEGSESFERELEHLEPYASEGLARIDGRRITVSETGRPYLRLIAAIFDRYLDAAGVRHSKAV
jgi:oxygen-independent coproporphyrinogen-3 oxidase